MDVDGSGAGTEGEVAERWDDEYRRGRYRDEPPVAMVETVIEEARARGLRSGLYIGCGNGRNLVPLREAGLDLVGLDVSGEALEALRERLPDLPPDRLVRGTVDDLPPGARFPLVVGIQVFQHGTRARCHDHVRTAAGLVSPGGLLCVRVNAVGTHVHPEHDVVETHPDGGLTVRYRVGPKKGLDVHFFAEDELRAAVPADFEPVVAPTRVTERRVPPAPGHWCQWEAIWQRAA
ncbi:class I SAM-dependent methyltransferase [Streptomyces megasporus]|uniref:class I SAM-dependent methyltransferase n=1 Tax=Streptomyces megasporus TaxID=44060 RepID=UPI0004E12652|nr:class I SAM-dependent methyltransferase [Streptomyces megasporus]